MPCSPNGQDASYAGMLSVEFMDLEGNVTRRAQGCRWIRDTNLAIHERTRVLPWGIRWTYRENTVGVPAGARTARLAFHFLKDPGGMAWVDDILVTEGGGYPGKGEQPLTQAEAREAPDLPFGSWLSTPAYANFF